MIDCLPGVPQPGLKDPRRKEASIIILNMAVCIHLVKPGAKTKTFGDYVHKNLRPYIMSFISPNVREIHGVWDSYTKGNKSTKASTHTKRGGTYLKLIKVEAHLTIPQGNISIVLSS